MKKILLISLLLSLTLYARDVVDNVGECKINWSEGVIICQGESAEGQNPYAAKVSAKVIAQRNLLEVVKGVQIESEVTIADGMLSSDIISSRVQGVIRGLQTLSNKYNKKTKSSIATVKLQMGKDLLAALLSDPNQLSWNEKVNQLWNSFSFITSAHADTYMPNEKETIKKILKDLRTQGNKDGAKYLENILSSIDKNNFSGILIDISGVSDFKKAMIVKLVDENGKEVYPAKLVDKRTLMKRNTSVGYMFGIEDARKNKRVFSTPLEIKASGVYKNKKSNIVLTKKQLNMLKILNSNILREAKIILVLGE